MFHKVTNLTPSLLVNDWAFWEFSFLPNHDMIACQQWTCLPVKCFKQVGFFCLFCFLEHSTTFPVLLSPLFNLFERCCWHKIQHKHIFTKISSVDKAKHKMCCLCSVFRWVYLSERIADCFSCHVCYILRYCSYYSIYVGCLNLWGKWKLVSSSVSKISSRPIDALKEAFMFFKFKCGKLLFFTCVLQLKQ